MNVLNWKEAVSGFVLCLAFVFPTGTPRAAELTAPTSEWVRPSSNGRLSYKATPRGDTIMDFSYAGYMGGGVPIPDVPVKRTVQPSGGPDDTAIIQAAINEVAAMKLDHGFRGAVLLDPGIFTCSNSITIPASGIVLRGSGSRPGTNTTIKMVGRPHLAVAIRSSQGRRSRDAQTATNSPATPDPDFKPAETKVRDDYIPSGAKTFHVLDGSAFSVGDTISIQRPVTETWIRFMQMDDLVRNGRPQTWIRAGDTTVTERRIAAISGNQITLDVPLTDSFDAKYLDPPGTSVVKIRPPARLSQCGIEHLHIESPPQAINHSQPHFTAMRINGQDCWARDVVIDETMNSVAVGGRRITLEQVTVNRKALHQGSSRPAEFAPNGGQVLLDRCTVNADNVWFVASGSEVAGPVVVLNCTFNGTSRAESHQRWSTGILYDNCRAPDGGIELRNRGSMGSGHGWSMGWGVLWNCVARDYIVQNPPGAMNWMIGCIGTDKLSPRPFGSGPNLPEGIKDSPGTPVTPRSLYLTQLTERLGMQALRNIGYTSPNLETAAVGEAGK